MLVRVAASISSGVIRTVIRGLKAPVAAAARESAAALALVGTSQMITTSSPPKAK